MSNAVIHYFFLVDSLWVGLLAYFCRLNLQAFARRSCMQHHYLCYRHAAVQLQKVIRRQFVAASVVLVRTYSVLQSEESLLECAPHICSDSEVQASKTAMYDASEHVQRLCMLPKEIWNIEASVYYSSRNLVINFVLRLEPRCCLEIR